MRAVMARCTVDLNLTVGIVRNYYQGSARNKAAGVKHMNMWKQAAKVWKRHGISFVR
jgi:hypothetical protein